MANKFFVFAFLFITLSVSLGFAACSVSSLTTSAASAAQVGNSVVVTATYSGTSCTGEQLYMDTSAGLTSDPSYRTLGSDSGSETFTVTAATEGTYTYSARLSTTQSTPSSISFISPDVLTISGSSSPSSVSDKTVGTSFTLNIIISNPSAASITTTYSFTYDSSYFSILGGTSGSVSVTAGDTTTLTRTVTPSTYYSGSKQIEFNLGSNDGAFTTTVTVVRGTSDTTSDTSGSRARTAAVLTEEAVATEEGTPVEEESLVEEVEVQERDSVDGQGLRVEVQAAIDEASMAISDARVVGNDVSAALAKLEEAQRLFDEGRYEEARALATEALELANSAAKPPLTQQTVIKDLSPATAEEAKASGFGTLILGVIVVVVALLVLAGIGYYLISRKKS